MSKRWIGLGSKSPVKKVAPSQADICEGDDDKREDTRIKLCFRSPPAEMQSLHTHSTVCRHWRQRSLHHDRSSSQRLNKSKHPAAGERKMSKIKG